MLIWKFIHFMRLIVGGIFYTIFKYPFIGDTWGQPLHINKSDIVLEVGSGYNPSVRSDILLEKFVTDTTERRYGAYIPEERPFVVGDACALPFVDNAIDYIICRHVIEHLESPKQMLDEFKRVSRKGFLSAPCGLWESISAGAYHKWFVFVEDGRLVLEQKLERKDRKYINKAKYEKKVPREVKYEYGADQSLEYKVIKKKCKGQFTHADSDNIFDFQKSFQSVKYPVIVRVQLFLKRILRMLFFKSSTNFDIYMLLACPICKSKLTKSERWLFCEMCNCKYQIMDEVPILLKERALCN